MFPVPLNQSPLSSLLTVSIEVDKLVNDNNSKQYPLTFIIANETTTIKGIGNGEAFGEVPFMHPAGVIIFCARAL